MGFGYGLENTLNKSGDDIIIIVMDIVISEFLRLIDYLQSVLDQILPVIFFAGVIIAYIQYRKQQKIKRDPKFITWKELGLLFGTTFILQLCLRFFTQIDYTDGFFYIINFVLIPILWLFTERRLTAEHAEKINTHFPGFTFVIALIISAFSAILIYLLFD